MPGSPFGFLGFLRTTRVMLKTRQIPNENVTHHLRQRETGTAFVIDTLSLAQTPTYKYIYIYTYMVHSKREKSLLGSHELHRGNYVQYNINSISSCFLFAFLIIALVASLCFHRLMMPVPRHDGVTRCTLRHSSVSSSSRMIEKTSTNTRKGVRPNGKPDRKLLPEDIEVAAQ